MLTVFMFEQYEPKKLTEEVYKFWVKNRIPNRIVDFHSHSKPKYYLLDGPPYVNGVPHVGHVMTTTMKDVWSKFKFMQGHACWWQPGFDCGGLPIENAVEKKLGIKSKKDIVEKVGVDKFIEECKAMAESNKGIWLDIYKKLGAWRGWLEPYMTYKDYYLESGWWTVKKMYERGMLVEGEKPVFWCPQCQTTLAGYEVTDSYKDVTDYSIYVKFPVKGKEREYLLIWTTTPWTLPANTAITVHPDETYVRMKVGEDVLILAEKRVKDVTSEAGIHGYTILEKFPGKSLQGVKYSPCLDIPIQKEMDGDNNARQVILSIPLLSRAVSSKVMAKKHVVDAGGGMEHMVTMDSGSGCVHTAPGHGDVDFRIGEHYKIPKLSPVDEEGKMMRGTGPFESLFVKDADPKIIEYLTNNGLLLWSGKITHSYPLCWRCKTPLVYRMSRQWFFTVDTIKEKMIRENQGVKWLPPFAQERFHNWLEGALDWAVSMQRFWGIPMPVWVCKSCGRKEVVGSRKELVQKATKKIPENVDLHKNSVDKIKLKCSCKKEMERIPDTLNVWFDSGISPWASMGYPFMNKEAFEKLWPVDLVCESQDQIRGWFYSLMFLGVSVFDMSPYKAVGMTGWTLDEKGEKMSKSVGNVVYAEDALKDVEPDALRLYYCHSVPPWETQNFSMKGAKETGRTLNILWNTAMFAKSYSSPEVSGKKISSKELKTEDLWMISRVNSLVENVTNDMENFNFHHASRGLSDFIMNDFSRWYIKIVRDRLSPWYEGKDKEAAQFTTLYVLEILARLMAPMTPFISEAIYQRLFAGKDRPESIHLLSWPKPEKEVIDADLEKSMEKAKAVVEAVNSLRQAKGAKLRWPLSAVYYRPAKEYRDAAAALKDIIANMSNVDELIILENMPKKERKPFEGGDVALGEVMKDKALLRELSRQIQVLRKKEGLKVTEKITLTLDTDKNTENILNGFQKELLAGVGASAVHFGKTESVKGSLDFDGKKIHINFRKG